MHEEQGNGGMVVHAFNPITEEAKAGESEFEASPVYIKSKVIQNYIMMLCLKQTPLNFLKKKLKILMMKEKQNY